MKTLETCNRKMLDQVYSEEEILELIKLDSILDFDKTLREFNIAYRFGVIFDYDSEENHNWQRVDQLLGKPGIQKIYSKPYNESEYESAKIKYPPVIIEAMVLDKFERLATILDFLEGKD